MKKTLAEITPRSARETTPDASAPLTPPAVGSVMSLDDLPQGDDARSQHLEGSLERAILPQPEAQASPPPAPAATQPPLSEPPTASVTTAATQPAPIPPMATAPAPAPAASAPAPVVTKMIATPIDGILRQRVRDLRGNFEISEAFVVETALREFFANRPTEVIAADLRARGGRLRRNR